MEQNIAIKSPRAGVVYGEIAYWILIIGTIVAVIGSIIYLASDGYINKTYLLDHLWQGADTHTIWEQCAGVSEPPQGHWYLGMLSQPDGIAMLGISISCLAAVFGTWGAFVQMARSRERLYPIFALIIAVILTLSALGIISLKH